MNSFAIIFNWNEIRVLGIERKSRYSDCRWIIMRSMNLE